jgi:hypothetical protein
LLEPHLGFFLTLRYILGMLFSYVGIYINLIGLPVVIVTKRIFKKVVVVKREPMQIELNNKKPILLERVSI